MTLSQDRDLSGQMPLWSQRQAPRPPLRLQHITRLPGPGDSDAYCPAHGAVYGTPGERCMHPRRVVPHDERTYIRGPAGPQCATEPCHWACCTEPDKPLDWAICGLELQDTFSELWTDVWSAAILGFSALRGLSEQHRNRSSARRKKRSGRSL